MALRYFDGLTRGLTPVRVGSGYGRFYCHIIPPHAGTGISFGLGWPCERRRLNRTPVSALRGLQAHYVSIIVGIWLDFYRSCVRFVCGYRGSTMPSLGIEPPGVKQLDFENMKGGSIPAYRQRYGRRRGRTR